MLAEIEENINEELSSSVKSKNNVYNNDKAENGNVRKEEKEDFISFDIDKIN
jgi:hypothetical protein